MLDIIFWIAIVVMILSAFAMLYTKITGNGHYDLNHQLVFRVFIEIINQDVRLMINGCIILICLTCQGVTPMCTGRKRIQVISDEFFNSLHLTDGQTVTFGDFTVLTMF